METYNASVENEGDKYFIKIILDKDEIRIPITEDDPNAIKAAFNAILIHLKKGLFEIALQNKGENLFELVAKEYVHQLNSEIEEIHGVMESNELIKLD